MDKPTHFFRPYAGQQLTIEVFLTGKVYEIGEHPYYKHHKIVEVQDVHGNGHDAFESELTKIK